MKKQLEIPDYLVPKPFRNKEVKINVFGILLFVFFICSMIIYCILSAKNTSIAMPKELGEWEEYVFLSRIRLYIFVLG